MPNKARTNTQQTKTYRLTDMRIKRILAAMLSVTALTTGAFAQSGLNDPMTKAMMDVYDQEIAANPQAYEIYFRRANEYYKFDQYLRALSDIDNAIKYTPKENTDLLFQCYSLRGDTYQMLGSQHRPHIVHGSLSESQHRI